MPRLIAKSSLNASTMDIMNVIRANAPYDYQNEVPKVTDATMIPQVGEIIYGNPAFSNQFINALVNRIALVRVNSDTFNNPYNRLKKGYLEFGETIEDIFVSIAKVVEYDPEKAEEREFKRTLPDVHSAFYKMNWRVMYPITIQDEDLRTAFLSMQGVQDLIGKIVNQVYQAYEYDEFLLFKYLIIKGYNKGFISKVNIPSDDIKEAGVAYRGYSNLMTFRSSNYNKEGVLTATSKDRQIIFMDALYNAKYDVDVLSAAFNMDKATYSGALYLIDNFTTFDNNRFAQILNSCEAIEEVTPVELENMKGVHAFLMSEEWFQVYDNLNKFTEKYVSSGLYWNYFYHTWKTIAFSPFANAIAFTTDMVGAVTSIVLKVSAISKADYATVITFDYGVTPDGSFAPVQFEQTEALTKAGIAVGKQGYLIVPAGQEKTPINLEAVSGVHKYKAGDTITAETVEIDDTITLSLVE